MIYFPHYSKNKIEVKLYLSHYATNSDTKNATGVHTSQFDLANLKPVVDKLYIYKLAALDADKLKPVPVDLKDLRDVVNKKVVQKYVCNAKIKDIEDILPNISNLATTVALNAKIKDVKNELPSITNLASNVSVNMKIYEVKGEIP